MRYVKMEKMVQSRLEVSNQRWFVLKSALIAFGVIVLMLCITATIFVLRVSQVMA